MKEEIKKALDKATPGPWKVWDRSDRVQVVESDGELSVCEMDGGSYGMWQHNAHLIANSPEWLRWQNERIEQLEDALNKIALYDRGTYEEDYDDMQDIAIKALGKEE